MGWQHLEPILHPHSRGIGVLVEIYRNMDQDETLQIVREYFSRSAYHHDIDQRQKLRTNLRNAEATFSKKSVQYELVLRLVAEYITKWKAANPASGNDKMQIDTAAVVPADDQDRLMAMLQDLRIGGPQ